VPAACVRLKPPARSRLAGGVGPLPRGARIVSGFRAGASFLMCAEVFYTAAPREKAGPGLLEVPNAPTRDRAAMPPALSAGGRR